MVNDCKRILVRLFLAESDGWTCFQITEHWQNNSALTNDRIAASCSQGTTGQLQPVTHSKKLPSERLLYFGTCRIANPHNSAKGDDGS
jgi:hypothetical protein